MEGAPTLFDRDDFQRGKEEWVGMPEYSNKEIKPFRTIRVHFKTKEAYSDFANLIGQNLTEKTLSITFPKAIRDNFANRRYTDES